MGRRGVRKREATWGRERERGAALESGKQREREREARGRKRNGGGVEKRFSDTRGYPFFLFL